MNGNKVVGFITLDDKKANISWKMNSSGRLYLGDLSVSDSSLMDAVALSEKGLELVMKIMKKYNKVEDTKPPKK